MGTTANGTQPLEEGLSIKRGVKITLAVPEVTGEGTHSHERELLSAGLGKGEEKEEKDVKMER